VLKGVLYSDNSGFPVISTFFEQAKIAKMAKDKNTNFIFMTVMVLF
jgi:hypothetical protein